MSSTQSHMGCNVAAGASLCCKLSPITGWWQIRMMISFQGLPFLSHAKPSQDFELQLTCARKRMIRCCIGLQLTAVLQLKWRGL